eukprot:12424931-Karenia_brevis.AAC.1
MRCRFPDGCIPDDMGMGTSGKDEPYHQDVGSNNDRKLLFWGIEVCRCVGASMLMHPKHLFLRADPTNAACMG